MRYRAVVGGGVVLLVLCHLGGLRTLWPAEAGGALPRETMAGQVVDPTGQPAIAATVWLVGGAYDEDAKILEKTTTDAHGRFTFLDAKAKYAERKARLPEVVVRDAQGRLGGNNHPWAYPGPTPRQDVQIKLLAVHDYHGCLLDTAGQPIAKADIHPRTVSPIGLHDEGYEEIDLFTELADELACRTGPDGTFTLRQVPVSGTVGAKITAPGFGSPYVASDLNEPVTLQLGRAGSIRGALIAPPGAKQLDTIELNAGGQPTEAKDARFRVYHHATAHAGRDGKFQFDGVSPGVYTVEPNLYESKLPYYTKKAASFIVKASQTATIEVPLLPAVAVRGQVVDKESRQGVEGVGLIASLISAEGYATFMRNTTSDARGRFVAYVAPGKVVISVRQPPTGYVVPHRNGNRSENAASGDVNWPAIELQRAVRLEGIVVDESGRPIPRAEVQGLLPSDPVDLVVQTADQNGKFMFSNLDPKETLALRARTATAVSDVAQVRPNDAKGPVRLALSSARAVTIRGVCVDVGGTPVRQAKIGIQSAWMLGPTGIGCSAGGCETDADGRFALRNLWPGFQYHVSVRAEGYDAFDSFSFSTQPGDNHDTGRLPLVSTGGVVEGVVVDSSGRPVGGARVFNSGDAPKVLSTMSDAAGRFRLEGFRVGKVYVFAEKHLYQSTAVRTAARSAGLKIILLRSDEPVPPWKPTREPRPVAQEQKAVRDLLETLWPLTPQQQRSWPIQSMARIDPEQALKWSAEAGGRYDAAVRRIVAERSAETDTGETIAMLADGHDRENYWTFMSLAKRHALSDPQNSLRFAEEAVLRARKLDQPDRSSALAEAGALVARLGRVDPGKKLIDEAASVAVRMATDGRQAYVRGRVAAALASFDLPRAMGLVEPVKDANERDRALATIAAAVAPQNLGKALEIINRLDKRSTLADNARLKIAYELASTRPDDALRVVETMSAFGAVKTKAEAFGWMATAVAPRNRQLAHSLIDRGMAIYEDPKEAQGFRSWSNYGGRTVFAACLVVHARQVGYPDMAGLIRRVLAMRPAGNDEWSPRENRATSIRAAKILALVDPGCALELLETVTPTDKMPEGAVDMMQDLDLLQAWVLIDFDYTASVIESQAKSAGKERQWTNYLIQSLELLNTPPADRIRPLLNNQGGFWFPEEEL